MRGIARIEALRANQEKAKRPYQLSDEVVESLWNDAPELDVSTDRIALLGECVDELGSKPRQAIKMRYHELAKPAEISSRLNLTLESVYVTLSRARSSLRACIERKLRERGGTN